MNRSDEISAPDAFAFLMGGGEMGHLIRSMDWSTTSLGPVAGWPQSLRTTLSICLASDLPICVIWGPGRVQLYNDAYRVICGDKHPRSMGQNFAECWQEAWPVIGEAHDAALVGDKAFLETQHIFLERHGYREECFFTFSFSPIRDEAGQVGGLFHPVIEMTAQRLAQRRTWALRDLAAQTSKAKSVSEVLALSAQTLAEYALDLPFVLTYALEPEGDQARLVAATGLGADTVARLGTVTLADLQAVGPHSVWPDAARLMPIIPPGASRPVAILIAGISPRLPMNEAYRSFFDLLASGVTTAAFNARAHDDERRQPEALAEPDRASEQQHRLLFEQTVDGIFVADATGRYVEVNTVGCEMLGYSREEVLARTHLDMIEPHEWPRVEPEIARFAGGQVVRSEWRFRRKDGSVFVGEISGRSLPNGRVQGVLRDITDRRAAEAAVRASEARIRAFADAAPAMLWETDPAGQCTFLSREWYAFTGQTEAQALGLGWTDATHPGDQAEAGRVFLAANAGRQEFRLEYRLRTGGGAYRWALDVGRPRFAATGKYLGMVGVVIDNDERKQAEVLLRASEARRRLALDAAELGMWHVDPATHVTKTDARFRAIFGTTETWTDYLQAVAVIHPDDQPAVLAAVAAATRLDDPVPYDIEYRIHHTDGSLRWVVAKGRSTLGGDGPTRRVVSFDGTVADITVRKHSEGERELLLARLRDQDQRKDEFLATLAHELRNPLAPMRNGLQVMRLAQDDPDATERVRAMMERQLARMVHLIDDLLDLSRISYGKIDLRQKRIELATAIQQAIETSRPAIEQADHELLIDMPPGAVCVNADLTRLAQVFSNLLNNAAKYTPRGGRIRLTIEHVEGEAVVSVKDNGIGIPTHMLSQVFQMFTQVDRTLERSQSGLGIGLAIVKRLVEMHGGSVEARSDGDGRGSEFIVRLPTVLPAAGGCEEEGAAAPVRPPPRRRILVVDDNHDAAASLALMLTIMGNETQTAHDGLEALEVAQAFRPDVVLLDIGLPKLNGYEVCRRIRQQAWGKGVVLFALTGWGQEEDQRRSQAAGFDAHIVKPVLPATLEKLLAGVPASKA